MLSPEHFKYWECKGCYSEKFPCFNLTDDDVIKLSFNSDFICSCTKFAENFPIKKNIVLELSKFHKSDKYGPDPEDNLGKCFELDVNFDY